MESLVRSCTLLFVCACLAGSAMAQSTDLGRLSGSMCLPQEQDAAIETARKANIFSKLGLSRSPASALKKHLRKGEIAEASDIYNQHCLWFAENQAKHQGLLEQLATSVKDRIEPALDDAANGLAGMSPEDFGRWGDVRIAIERANVAVLDAESELILANPLYTPTGLPATVAARDELTNELRHEAPFVLKRFLIEHPDQNFAYQYPVDFEWRVFFDENATAFREAIAQLPPEKIAALHNTYSSLLSPRLLEELSHTHVEKIRSELADKHLPRLMVDMQALSASLEAGLQSSGEADESIKLVMIHETTPASTMEFSLELDNELPVAHENVESADDASRQLSGETSRLVLLQPVSTKIEREITDKQQIESRFVAGESTQLNQAYLQAQNEVDNARAELQNAVIRKASIDAQYCQAEACWVKLAAQIAAAAAVDNANERLATAMALLGQTPMQIGQPVYEGYTYHTAIIRARKQATAKLYFIDELNKEYFSGHIELTDQQEFRVAYNLKDSDPDYYSVSSQSVSEDEIDAYEAEPIRLTITDLLSEIAVRPETMLKRESLAAVKDELRSSVAARTVAASKAKESNRGGKADPRMESVVVVLNPGGSLGTGFYVAPDYVVTNEHVVSGSKFVELKLFNGKESFGKVIAEDKTLDLALIKAESRGKPLSLLVSDQELALGGSVEVIGHPSGFLFSVTRGVLSGIREIEAGPFGERVLLMQTDAAINPGNSGGPLLLGSKVIGVNSFKFVGDYEGLGFALHYSELQEFLSANGVGAERPQGKESRSPATVDAAD